MKIKKLAVIFSFLFFVYAVYAYDGVFSEEKNLSVLKTQWFDIIYPEKSGESARILYENADRIYDEITSMYGITQKFRMPVVLAPDVEEFNAYWSSYPYNLIVIYDTGPIEELNVFSDGLLSTFRHELTHGVTYNNRSPFWYKVDQIFGDSINFAQLSITRGWAEGATLASESFNGEGRLNDEYAMHMVKQAKIEDDFPSYSDVQSASDLYPAGGFYQFNGAFAQYLQKTYGLEKYADFWYRCVNGKALTAGWAFRSAFGCKLSEAWKDFEKNYYIPDLTEIKAKEIGGKNDGALYSYLSASADSLIFTDEKTGAVYRILKNHMTDSKTENENSDGSSDEPEKLFYLPKMESVKASRDGRYLSLDVYTDENPTEKKSVKLYDLRHKKFISIEETGLQESTLIKNGDDYYLVCQGFASVFTSLKIFKLDFDSTGDSLLSLKTVAVVDFPVNTIPYSFTDLGNGTFAYVKKDGMKYSICISDLQGNVLNEIASPKERMVIRYISGNAASDGSIEIAFSWTEPKSLPRFGKVKIYGDSAESEISAGAGNAGSAENADFSGNAGSAENAAGTKNSPVEFYLQNIDFSGGVYWPVLSENSDEIFYVGKFYRNNKLFSAKIPVENSWADADKKGEGLSVAREGDLSASLNFGANGNTSQGYDSVAGAGVDSGAKLNSSAGDGVAGGEVDSDAVSASISSTNLPEASPYNPFDYYCRGVIFPVSMAESRTFIDGSAASYSLPLGLTYISSNPWLSGLLQLSAGYGFSTKSFGLDAVYSSGSDTSLFSYTLHGSAEFDSQFWKQASGSISAGSAIPLGNQSYVSVTGSALMHYGRSTFQIPDSSNYIYGTGSLSAGYSNIHKKGPGKYEKGGISASAGASYIYYGDATATNNPIVNGGNVGFAATAYIPHLIPVASPERFTVNLPVKINLNLFSTNKKVVSFIEGYVDADISALSTSELPSYNATSFQAETILFGYDIQKAVPVFSCLFVNDFRISAAYTGGFSIPENLQQDYWRITHLNKYFDLIKENQMKYSNYVSVKASLGLSPNFGGLASYGNKTYLCVQITWLDGNFHGIDLGADINF